MSETLEAAILFVPVFVGAFLGILLTGYVFRGGFEATLRRLREPPVKAKRLDYARIEDMEREVYGFAFRHGGSEHETREDAEERERGRAAAAVRDGRAKEWGEVKVSRRRMNQGTCEHVREQFIAGGVVIRGCDLCD